MSVEELSDRLGEVELEEMSDQSGELEMGVRPVRRANATSFVKSPGRIHDRQGPKFELQCQIHRS